MLKGTLNTNIHVVGPIFNHFAMAVVHTFVWLGSRLPQKWDSHKTGSVLEHNPLISYAKNKVRLLNPFS